MLFSDLERESGEPYNEHAVRCARDARKQQMLKVLATIDKAKGAITSPADDHIIHAIEALAEIVDDIIERNFV